MTERVNICFIYKLIILHVLTLCQMCPGSRIVKNIFFFFNLASIDLFSVCYLWHKKQNWSSEMIQFGRIVITLVNKLSPA